MSGEMIAILFLILGLFLWMWNKSQVRSEALRRAAQKEAKNWKESFTTQLTLELMDDQEVMDGLRKGNWRALQRRVNDWFDKNPIDDDLERYLMTNRVGEQLLVADRYRKEQEKVIDILKNPKRSAAEADR